MQKILRKDELIHYIIQSDVQEESHQHGEIELLFVLEGTVLLEDSKECYSLQAEDIVIVNAYQKHHIIAENALYCCLHISYEQLSKLIKKNRILFWCNSTVDNSALYQELRHILLHILRHDQEEEALLVTSLYYELLDHLVHNFLMQSHATTMPDKQQKNFARMEEIRTYINCNYHQEITLQDLADHLGFSMPYMSKFFKQQFGMNFVEYISSIRLNHAVDDLIYTDFPITRIVLENGFANVSVFNKLFKEVYRLTPSVYRKDFKNKTSKEKEQKKNSIDQEKIGQKLDVYVRQHQQRAQQVELVLDSAKTMGIEHTYQKLVNIGYAFDLLRGDLQNQILMLKEAYHFQYARFFGILANDMEICSEGGKQRYNFSYVDKVLDFLTQHDILPFIELGPKAKMLHEAMGKDIVYRKEYTSSLSELKDMLHAFLVHCSNRYGKKALKQWYFEVWDPANVGEPYKAQHAHAFAFGVDYLTLFSELAKEVRQVSPDSCIGGGGFSTNFVDIDYVQLFDEWAKQEERPSFLSFNLYPYQFCQKERRVVYDKHPDFMVDSLKHIQSLIKQSQLSECPLIISEWNISISNRNAIHDTCFKGAYLIKNTLDCLGQCRMMGYWFLSDLLSEYKDTYGMLFGGSGLISKDGLCKPASHAMSFLRKLGDEVILQQKQLIATKKSEDEYVLIAHNYKHFNNYYYQHCENQLSLQDRNRIFEDERDLPFKLQLKQVKNGRYRIKMYHISTKHGSVLDEWIKMGELSELKNDEFEYLERVSYPKLTLRQMMVEHQTLPLSFTLLPNEFVMMYIYYDFE